MAEVASIARPYADALFKSGQSDLAGVLAWLENLAVIAGDPQLLQFAESPKATDDQIFDLVVEVSRHELPANARNFLRAVIENGRLNALPEITAQFRSLKNAQSGLSDAVIYSAFPIDGSVLGDVAAWLEQRFGRKLNVHVEHDASLIGGIRVVVGDEVLDASVKARLEQMKSALTA
jgi:F-type H+-transporting ATPase subunit delta